MAMLAMDIIMTHISKHYTIGKGLTIKQRGKDTVFVNYGCKRTGARNSWS